MNQSESGWAVRRLIPENKVSPTEIVRGCLKRIEQRNPTLNAFIAVTAGQALKQAEEAESEIKKGNWKGHLHGIPVGIKDMFDTAGIRTTAAFEALKDRVPEKDAEVVAKLKAAGAIIVGKMNMQTSVAFSADNRFFCNYYGLPAISIPCGFSNNGVPLGLQIVGPQWGERRVLDMAHRYQNATDWHWRHPSISN